MDAAIGACWRCGQPGKLKCPDCEFGLYCGHMCVSDDKYRHKIECFHARKNKTCHFCKKVTQSAKQCSACLTVWYCGRECQRRAWRNHKRDCLEEEQKIRNTVKLLETDFFSLLYNRDEKPDTFVHVCYWGNTPAIDLLKLPQNEFSIGCRPEKLCLLLSGVGDLRYVIKTGALLPDDFNGRVDFYLNDIDVHVLARNVLFIYMICRSHDLKAVAQDLVQIWYSLCFTIDICEHLECRLEELIHISSHNLMKETQKALIVSDADLDKMKVLWSQWLKLSKTGGPRQHILKQRQAVHSCGFEVEKDWISYLNSVPQRHQKSLRDFWKDCILMSASNQNQSQAVFQNITLLCDDPTRHIEKITSSRQQFPHLRTINDILPEWYKREPLVYTIPADTLPFIGWDYVDAKSFCDVPNLSVMYSNYISHMIEKFALHVRRGHMSLRILLCDCFKLDKEIDSS
ncbi:uncharacterized protein [Ptychodera flava]|uniref:uncharacterized protein n=1 Tax=Ptychodera flava TaxID=63121 RepID=UPI00396AA69A